MDFKNELKKFTSISFDNENNNIINNDEKDFEKVENSLKTEIRKSNLILSQKIDSLQNEIKNLNLENDELKKDLFRTNKEIKNLTNTLFDILDVYLGINNLKNEENKEILELMIKKVNSILKKNKIIETAHVGDVFDYNYHEILNENLIEKDKYIITNIISQGYIKDGHVIKIAKVIVE